MLQFRHSTLILICYVSLELGLWRRVIKIGQLLIEDVKLNKKHRINVLHYMLEAQSQLGKNTLILRQYLDHLQHSLSNEKISMKVMYINGDKKTLE